METTESRATWGGWFMVKYFAICAPWALATFDDVVMDRPCRITGNFYETAGDVNDFVVVFAFVFSLVAFLLLLLSFVRVWIHLGLLYALAGSR
jgi:hypothetical protein